jgi:diguanylate cyclase (GGDEF)-like protein
MMIVYQSLPVLGEVTLSFETKSIISTIQKLYTQDREHLAIIQAQTLVQSLNNGLLKAILAPNADNFSDINFRLSGFKSLDGLIVYDNQSNAIFKYKDSQKILSLKKKLLKNNTIFTPLNLYIKKNILADGYTFGYTLLDINLSKHIKRQKDDLFIIFLIFPFALILSFLISIFLSKSYTKPFALLSSSIKNAHPTTQKIIPLKTNSRNEIKELFDGFNKMMQQIFSSSEQLIYQANHDELTGVYNRFFIENEIVKALKNENCEQYCILNIDIDNFKLINEAAGYQAGDELLKMLSNTYSQILPKDSIFARADGNHFIVLSKIHNKKELTELINNSIDKLSDFRFIWEQKAYAVSSSIGVVTFKAYEYTLNELMKIGNSSLYTAKSLDRNTAYIYKKGDEVSKRFDIELKTASYIKEALNKGASRFELFAQNIVPLQYESSEISYEILIRMWDKDGNFVAPDNFLPTAQRYQLMCDIDIFVLWTYLETVTKNKKHIEHLHSVHINLDGASLNNVSFQRKVKEAVEYFDFPWEKLELEVTETSAVGNFNKANDFIKWLKSVGIGLALDDFGTGMASFEYLKSLPFDIVKIDGSFIKDMHTDPIDKAVIKYIHEIATLKKQETVAEYVETKEDVEELKKIGITYGQGYFLGKPKPLKEYLC